MVTLGYGVKSYVGYKMRQVRIIRLGFKLGLCMYRVNFVIVVAGVFHLTNEHNFQN